MKYIILMSIIVTIAYLTYYFRYHLRYFFSLLKVTNKNNLGIKKLQNKGLNKRKVSNEDIEKYVNFAKIELYNRFGTYYFGDFSIDKELERHLKYSRFSEKYLQELLYEILEHLKINEDELDFDVEYMSSKRNNGYAGLYYEKEDKPKARIHLCVKNDMNYENVVSTLVHECCHHLLLSNGIRMEKRIDNECLTDITTLFAGFGNYMVKGYKISNRIIYEEEFLRLVDKDSIGYLSSQDLKYILKKYKKYFKN